MRSSEQDPTQLIRQLVKGKCPRKFLHTEQHLQRKVYTNAIQRGARFNSKWAANFGSVLCVVLAIESWTKHEQRGSEVFLQV